MDLEEHAIEAPERSHPTAASERDVMLAPEQKAKKAVVMEEIYEEYEEDSDETDQKED